MILEYKKVESSIEPKLIDESLSNIYVYIRRKVNKIEKNGIEFYEYEEAKITKDKYPTYLKELDFSNMLEDIEDLQNKNKNLTEQITQLTECLLEMSETVYA